jgi:hypothetical protein
VKQMASITRFNIPRTLPVGGRTVQVA